MSDKIELYKEIHLDSWQDFVKKLMPGEEYHYLLKSFIWRGQRRKNNDEPWERELRASYFREPNDCFKLVDIQEYPGKTYVLDEDKYESFCEKLSAHYDRFADYQNLSGKIHLNKGTAPKEIFSIMENPEYIKNYAIQYKDKFSNIDVLWLREYDLKKWIWLQHYGVETPLLDWTRFPFYALFFAYQKTDKNTQSREIFALDTGALARLWSSLHRHARDEFRRGVLEKYYNKMLPPYSCPFEQKYEFICADMSSIRIISEDIEKSVDNARIVRQGGLFTHTPGGYSIEEWLRRIKRENPLEKIFFIDWVTKDTILYKFIIPDDSASREDCLIYLNSMNVNDAMIYPDFEGLANAVNTANKLVASQLGDLNT